MKSTKKTPIKKRDRAATEKALVNAAMQLFASKGFDGTRTLEIAQLAKVNEALIARYFGGKEGLLIAVLQDEDSSQHLMKNSEVKCQSADWIPNFGDAQDFRAGLRLFFKAGLKHFQEKDKFISIILSQALIDPKMAELLRNKLMGKNFSTMAESLKKYFGKKLKTSELEPLIILLMASNFSLNFMTRTIHQLEDKKVEKVIDLLIDALVSHLD